MEKISLWSLCSPAGEKKWFIFGGKPLSLFLSVTKDGVVLKIGTNDFCPGQRRCGGAEILCPWDIISGWSLSRLRIKSNVLLYSKKYTKSTLYPKCTNVSKVLRKSYRTSRKIYFKMTFRIKTEKLVF